MSRPEHEIVTETLHFIYNHKDEAVSTLFPDASFSYQAGWCARNTFDFWCDLDLSNRERLVEAAREFYAKPSEVRPSGPCRNCGDHTMYRSQVNTAEWCCHHCSY